MNLYSNKQKWKIALLVVALLLVGVSLFISNSIVTKVSENETMRAKQWAGTIRKKVELVQLTNRTFTQLRQKEQEKMRLWVEATKELSSPSSFDMVPEFPMQIVKGNVEIPVILLDGNNSISGFRNIDFDTSSLRLTFPSLSTQDLNRKFEDSLLVLAENWKTKHPSFTIEVYEGLFMTYVYDDSKEIVRLEKERDSLIRSFNKELIDNEGSVPVLLVNEQTKEIIGSNLSEDLINKEQITRTLKKLAKLNAPIVIDFKNGQRNLLYYDNSPEVKQMQYFPYIQFLIIGLFVLIGYLIFSTFRKAEQNQVWAGMAKETAHQLGTPLSSLMAWIQLLEGQNVDPSITKEMQKDLDRLVNVSDRFSKIGSGTKLEEQDISETIQHVIDYLKPRVSNKVEIQCELDPGVQVMHNGPLMQWVIENICKNAIDAMEGNGRLAISVSSTDDSAQIDIKDTGKGMTHRQMKAVFQPGYTTKRRGWGLGLSLVKRIVKEYHKGKVFVQHSELGKGTTFRIVIPKKH